MKKVVTNSLVIAALLGQGEAVKVQKFLSPLNYYLKQNSLAQVETTNKKFMSISNTLEAENSFESSSISKTDDFIKEAHENGV